MNAWEAVRTSLAEILGHKLRSALTLVGVVLGTTSLVVMVSVIGGVAVAVQKGLGDLGYDGVMVVQAQAPAERLERKKQGYSRGLRAADLRAIEAGREVISAAAPVVGFRERALLNGRALEVNGEGVTAEYGRIRNREVGRGRYIAARDVESVAPVCVLGHKLAEDAFGAEDPLGREVQVRGVRLTVVGVLRPLGSNQVQDDDMERDTLVAAMRGV